MFSIIKNDKGAISIYLCLILAVLIPVIVVIVDVSRYKGIELKVENATNLGADSVLAEYNRVLLDDYGLLFVDTSYDNSFGNISVTEEHFEEYVNHNINENKGLLIFGAKDMHGLYLNDLKITEVSRATDNKGEVFRYMANSYMLEKYGYTYIESVQDLIGKYDAAGLSSINICDDSEKANRKLNDFEPPDEQGVEWTEIKKEDPVPGITKLRSVNILYSVTDMDFSRNVVDLASYASKRQLVNGNGKWSEWEDRNGIMDALLFNEYVMHKLRNYRDTDDNRKLLYETEYVIIGDSSDAVNLEKTVNRILLIRGASNTIYFLQDKEMKELTKTASEALASLCGCPSLCIVFEGVLDVAWIYAESLYDVRKLLHGESEPLIANKESWDLSIESALYDSVNTFKTPMLDKKEDQKAENKRPYNREGLFYEDYLRILLYLTNNDKKTMRCMDIVEMNVRNKTGKDMFRLDDCIAAFTIQAIYKSKFGYEFLYEKEFGYQ